MMHIFSTQYGSHYMYMKIHVPSMLAKGVETINKQTQQTSSHNGFENNIKTATLAQKKPQWLRKSHNGLEK